MLRIILLALTLSATELREALREIRQFNKISGIGISDTATNVTSIKGTRQGPVITLENTWIFAVWGGQVHGYDDLREPWYDNHDVAVLDKWSEAKRIITPEEATRRADRFLEKLGYKKEKYPIRKSLDLTAEAAPTNVLKLPAVVVTWRRKDEPEYHALRVVVSLASGRIISLLRP
jgi:hypothetical protein